MSTSCPHCGLQFSEPALTAGACPNCGESLGPVVDGALSGAHPPVHERPLDPIRAYFARVWRILTQPTAFFRAMPVTGGVSGPLAFALITHWLGSALGYLWRLLIGGAIGNEIEQILKLAGEVAEVDNPGRNAQIMDMANEMKHWAWGVGSVIIDPFSTLLQIFFVSFLVFLGARIFVNPARNGAPKEITFESALRIVCYGMTPAILTALPIFGGFVAYLYKVVITVIAAREVYRVGNGRAALVAMFPHVLLVSLFTVIGMAILVAMIKFFTLAM